MILGFKKTINSKPTNFVYKIWEGFLQLGIEANANEFLKLGNQALAEGYIVKTYTPKIHTIREDKTNRWKPGVMIHFFTNMYTKNMLLFAPKVPVISIQKLEIIWIQNTEKVKLMGVKYDYICKIIIDRKFFGDVYFYKKKIVSSSYNISSFTANDGFDSIDDFFSYFNSTFTGKIIHWTNKKY